MRLVQAMSVIQRASCDVCGATAPEGYNDLFPEDAPGWMSLRRAGPNADFCSFACLREWATGFTS